MTETESQESAEASPIEADKGAASAETPDPERAFERLAENEALRRDLDDATFGPLLDLCASLAVARADRFASTDDLYRALRALLGGAGDYARAGETLALAQGFAAILSDDEANLTWMSLESAHSPQERAASLTRSIARATGIEGALE